MQCTTDSLWPWKGKRGFHYGYADAAARQNFKLQMFPPFLLLEQILDSLMDAFLRICHWQRLSHGVREPQEMKEMKPGPLAKLDCLIDKLI